MDPYMPHTNEPDEGVPGELTQDSQSLPRRSTPLWSRLTQGAHALSERLGPNGALILILAFGLVLVVALSFAAAQVYDNIVDADGVAGIDRPLLDFAMTLRSPWLDIILTGYTEIAGPLGMPIIAIAAALVLGLRRRSWTPVILIVAAGSGSLLMTVVGKNLFGRDRPPLSDAVPPYEYSASFPSGHTLNAVAVVGVIAYLIILRQTKHQAVIIGAAALFALTTGLDRIYLGHHWATDVLGAWALGAAWLALVITAHQLYLTVRRRREAHPPDTPLSR
ncbi:phosphatase PAP2 family protein [Microbacterium sp. CBA3102]|uniref:phosphatase PAP2 family protein n=1 Tax=Microbacterium sp. CBA3102 TaxID=2603598 RepID=UPI001D157C0B|nr:phosphatase PAP2 family protein [Microbacterium sp. CBA3102]